MIDLKAFFEVILDILEPENGVFSFWNGLGATSRSLAADRRVTKLSNRSNNLLGRFCSSGTSPGRYRSERELARCTYIRESEGGSLARCQKKILGTTELPSTNRPNGSVMRCIMFFYSIFHRLTLSLSSSASSNSSKLHVARNIVMLTHLHHVCEPASRTGLSVSTCS